VLQLACRGRGVSPLHRAYSGALRLGIQLDALLVAVLAKGPDSAPRIVGTSHKWRLGCGQKLGRPCFF